MACGGCGRTSLLVSRARLFLRGWGYGGSFWWLVLVFLRWRRQRQRRFLSSDRSKAGGRGLDPGLCSRVWFLVRLVGVDLPCSGLGDGSGCSTRLGWSAQVRLSQSMMVKVSRMVDCWGFAHILVVETRVVGCWMGVCIWAIAKKVVGVVLGGCSKGGTWWFLSWLMEGCNASGGHDAYVRR